MGFIIELFNTYFYQPIFNLLVILYNYIPGHDLGVVIIALTIIIKAFLLPFTKKSISSQKAMQDLQPKIEEIKKKHTKEKEKQAQALMELYKNEKVNPFSSCLPLLIQFPFLIAVYKVFLDGFKSEHLDILYPFVFNPGSLNPISLGFFDLSVPSAGFALAAAIAQYWQSKMLISKKPEVKGPGSKDESMLAGMNKQMTYLFPIITFIIGLNLPSGLMVYWLTTTLITGLQQKYIFGKTDKKTESQKAS